MEDVEDVLAHLDPDVAHRCVVVGHSGHPRADRLPQFVAVVVLMHKVFVPPLWRVGALGVVAHDQLPGTGLGTVGTPRVIVLPGHVLEQVLQLLLPGRRVGRDLMDRDIVQRHRHAFGTGDSGA